MTANRGVQAIHYVSCASLLSFPTSPSYVGFALERDWDETLVPSGTSADELSWTDWYASCPQFAQPWAMTQEGAEWPDGYSLAAAGNVVSKRRLVSRNKICVPMAITPYVIREHHESVGHVGQEKLLLDLPRLYNLATEGRVLSGQVHRLVSTPVLCQA